MALPLVLRNLPKINGSILLCTNLTRSSSVISNVYFSQLSVAQHRISEVKSSKRPLLSQQSIVLKAPVRLSHGDHSLLWTVEKGLSASLLAIIPAAFAFPSPILDNLLVVAVVAHQHWGIEAMVIDYVRPIIFGSVIPKISLLLVYALSAATLGGLLYFNYNDIGITALIKKLWALGNQEESEQKEEQK